MLQPQDKAQLDYLHDQVVEVMDCPTQNSDFNPIENLGTNVKARQTDTMYKVFSLNK